MGQKRDPQLLFCKDGTEFKGRDETGSGRKVWRAQGNRNPGLEVSRRYGRVPVPGLALKWTE